MSRPAGFSGTKPKARPFCLGFSTKNTTITAATVGTNIIATMRGTAAGERNPSANHNGSAISHDSRYAKPRKITIEILFLGVRLVATDGFTDAPILQLIGVAVMNSLWWSSERHSV